MKKMIGLLTFLFIIYFGLQILFVVFGKGHDLNYEIKSGENSVLITERYNAHGKDKDSYSLNINVDETTFSILTFYDFKKSSEIVTSVKYFKDEKYKCIFVKYRGDVILNDVLCHNGTYTIPYHNILDASVTLKSEVENLAKEGYVAKNWLDDKEIMQAHGSLILYLNNHVSGHYVGIAENRMLYKVNNEGNISHRNILSPTAQVVHAFANDKYIAYNSAKETATEYNIYSLTGVTTNTIYASNSLKNQMILGSYGDSVYIYDLTNKIEYELDTETEKVLEVGSAATKIKYYEGGQWKYATEAEFNINNIDFGSEYENDQENQNYAYIIKRGYDVGYYYYFKYINGYYEVYRSTIQDKDNLTYLFRTDSIKSVKFVGEYVYYLNSNVISYYHNMKGNRTLLYFDGLNRNSLYTIYSE